MSSMPRKASQSMRTGLACPVTGKARYRSAEKAQDRLARPLRSVDGSGNVPADFYFCVFCEGWHLTHHDGGRRY